MSYQRSGSNQRPLTDFDSAHDYCAAANCGAAADESSLHRPVTIALAAAVAVGGTWMPIIDEYYPMTDEDLVLDFNARAYKGVTRNFASPANRGVALDFDERADCGFVADRASIEIYEWRDSDILAEFHVGGDRGIFGY